MTAEPQPDTPIEPGESGKTVQLLVKDAGNRAAIGGMLEDHFAVETSQTVTAADLYLIEDHLFPEYRATLRERVEQEAPAFCPVVLIRRESTDLGQGSVDPSAPDGGVRYDEVVDAPINPPQLIRRLNSLLVRRQQSRELMQQVSALEKREQRLGLFEQGVESTGNGIVMTDSTGTIEYVNPALESIVGYTEADMLGESPQILLPEGTGEVFDAEFWRTMMDRGEWEGDIIIEDKDSHRLVVNATATELRDPKNETQGFVIVLSDITERIQREQDLEDRELELDLLRQILMRYLRHNLRNDLNVIQGNAELLQKDDTLSQKQIKSVETIIENAEDLMEKSDTARTYSSLLERETELSPFDLSEITRKAVQTVREDHADVTFELDVPETCEIRARDGIQRAFEELIDNAARHNDATDPWVRIQVRDRDGARLVIEDNGPGIPDQEIESLEKGTETKLTHSQGVGLWLSKWVIEGVDGTLSIELTDTGTRVTADFPPIATVGSTGQEVSTLKERERRLQTITDRMTDAIIEVDAEMAVTRLDGRAERIFDIEGDAIMGQNLWDTFPDLRDTQFETVVHNAMESRTATSVEQYSASVDAWLEFNVYPEFDGGLSFYTRDITERKERELEIQRLNERFELVVEGAELGVWDWDMTTDEVELNEQYVEMLGYSKQEFGQHVDVWKKRIHPDDREQVEAVIDAHIAGETEDFETEYRLQTAEGDWKWLRSIGRIVDRDDEGAPLRFVGVQIDISEQKEREEELQERVKELSAIHAATNLFQTVDAPMEELLSEFVESIPESFRYPDITVARIQYGDFAVSTVDFENRDHVLTAHADLDDGSALDLEVGYMSDLRIDEDDPFLAEEEELLDTLVTVIKNHVQRRVHLAELERTEDLLTNAERLGDVGAWEVDLETSEVFYTKGAKRIHGVAEEFEPTPEVAMDFFHPEDRESVSDAIETCAESGESFGLEARITTADGDERWVEIQGEPLEASERPYRVRGYVQDITERKERNRRYEAIFNQTFQFTGLLEPDGTVIEANQAALKFAGLDREDVIGKPFWEAVWWQIDDATQQEVREAIEQAAEGEFVRYEVEVQGKDDTAILDFSIRPITDDQNNVILLVPEGRDVTEHKERKSQLQRYEYVFDSVLSGIAIASLDGELTNVNPAVLDMWGFDDRDAVLGRPVTEFWKDPEKAAAIMETVKEQGSWEGESEAVRADGSIFHIRSSVSLLKDEEGDPIGVMASLVDITERKERERKLADLNERHQTMIEAAPDPIFVANVETGEILETNRAAEELLGTSRENIVGRQYTDTAPEEDAELYQAVFQQAQTGVETFTQLPDGSRPQLVTEEGETVPVEFSLGVASVSDENLAIGIFRDVSERVEREREIHNEHARFKGFFEKSFDAMVIADDGGNYIDANESATELFGLSRDELLDRSIDEFAPDDFDFAEPWKTFRESEDERGTFPLVRADGDERVVDFAATRDIVPGQHLLILRDVTETKRQERQLKRQVQQLEGFGDILSHDMKNPLNVATGWLDHVRETGEMDHLDDVEQSLLRIETMLEDMRSIMEEGALVSDISPVDLEPVVQSVWETTETGDAILEIDETASIKADESALTRLLENLLKNAVEHGNEDMKIRVGTLSNGFFVEDNGPGIPDEDRDSIFEPKFTTSKEGTGFGLVSVRQIALAHGWDITVTEGTMDGSRFEFTDFERADLNR